MLTAVVCSLLCGVRGYESLVEWLHELPVEVWQLEGIHASHAVAGLLSRVVDAARSDRVGAGAADLGEALLLGSLDDEDLAGANLDGKTLCGTLRPLERSIHLWRWSIIARGYVLSQSRVDEKTNEHKAALPLLKAMVLHGRVIVGDAMFCQREICQQIVDSDGDYLVAVKENQPALLREISLEFLTAASEFSPRRTSRTASGSEPRQHTG